MVHKKHLCHRKRHFYYFSVFLTNLSGNCKSHKKKSHLKRGKNKENMIYCHKTVKTSTGFLWLRFYSLGFSSDERGLGPEEEKKIYYRKEIFFFCFKLKFPEWSQTKQETGKNGSTPLGFVQSLEILTSRNFNFNHDILSLFSKFPL